MKLDFFRQIMEKISNIKFRENPSCRRRVVPCGEKDGRTDEQTKIRIAVRNFAFEPKRMQQYKLPSLIPSP